MDGIHKYLSLLVIISISLSSISIIGGRRSHGHSRHHGGNYRVHRRYDWGPYFGLGLTWGYPGFYVTPSFAQDNAGKTYWIIHNRTSVPLWVKSDRDETDIPAGMTRKLYRKKHFDIHVFVPKTGKFDQKRHSIINTRQHTVKLYLDETGKPFFNL